MAFHRRAAVAAACCAAFVFAGCGGGGAGAPPAAPEAAFAVTALQGEGQDPGPTAAGNVTGGETVRIFGRGFEAGVTVMFDTVAAPTVTLLGPTELQVVTPAMPAGSLDLTIENPDGEQLILRDGFAFGVPPQLVAVAAVAGPTQGEAVALVDRNTEVELTGTGFLAGATVTVGGLVATTTFVNDTTVRVAVPLQPLEGDFDVRLRNPEGLVATLPAGLFYTQRFSLEPQPGFGDEATTRFLFQRIGFGAPDAVIEASLFTPLSATVSSVATVVRDARLLAVEANAGALYGENAPDVPGANVNDRANQEWWIHLMQHNPFLAQERLTWFLHDHFATSQDGFGGNERHWMWAQINLFRQFSMPLSQGGLEYDWRALLTYVCKDRAMLAWLDGVRSTANAPNENFARELWELFMLGEGNGYDQADIVEAAKAFTGFRELNDEFDSRTVRYEVARHDAGPKTIFGVTGNFGYDAVWPYHEGGPTLLVDSRDSDGGIVALTLAQRPVEASEFICRKLVAYYLREDPSDELVAELAALLRAPGPLQWNLKPILVRIWGSKAMFARETRGQKIREPIEYLLQFVRQTEIDVSESRLRSKLGELNQAPMDPPDVSGWPAGNAWMDGQSMLGRVNFLRDVVRDLDDVATQIDPLVPPVGQRSPTQLVEHIAGLLGVTLSDEARTDMIAYVTSTLDGSDVTIPFDFDPANDGHLEMKTRGLLYMIAQYHEAHRG